MDNLTFTAEVDVLNSVLTVSTTTRKGHKYQAEIKDFIVCQRPKDRLTKAACIEVIRDKLDRDDDLEYGYYNVDDTIEVIIRYMPGYRIEFTLTRCAAPAIDLEQELATLKKRLDDLETDEVVHVHKYPSWDSLDEFKKLPGFKFMEAAENPAKYFKQIPGSSVLYLGEYLGKFRYMIAGVTDATQTIEVPTVADRRTLGYYEGCNRVLYGCTQDKELLETDGPEPHKNVPYRYFPRSVKMVILPDITINQWVMRYITRYVYGWVILNHPMLAFRTVRVSIDVKDGKDVYVSITRSKRMSVPKYPKEIHKDYNNQLHINWFRINIGDFNVCVDNTYLFS